MAHVTVVGSGPSGVHAALTLLQKGYDVTMVDVGRTGPPVVDPTSSLNTLKETLADPVSYLLGERFGGVILPSFDKEYYGVPPLKRHVFASSSEIRLQTHGFDPLFSYAQGGLAQAWTAGCYPFTDAELSDFPFDPTTLHAGYNEVGRRIGVTGDRDDLTPFLPWHEGILPPLPLDEHSRVLLQVYERHRTRMHTRLRCVVGRTRVATLTSPQGDRQACAHLGRCLWGCPVGALYTPDATLRECLTYENFSYRDGLRAEWFTVGTGGTVESLIVTHLTDDTRERMPIDQLVLAAGALSTSRIYLRSVYHHTGTLARLTGLMDNRQVLVPFLNLRMVGKPFAPDTYQYHLLGLGITSDDPRGYIHGQITTLKTALLHPIIQKLPVDLRTATFLTRHLHAALGVVNLNLADTRRDTNVLTLDDPDAPLPTLDIQYRPPTDERDHLRAALRTLRRGLRTLGCLVPPGMTHVRPMGASVHYAGTIPMQRDRAPHTTNPNGRSHDYPNLVLADGATFPFLPAKNLTFTLMANAVRIVRAEF